MTNLELYLLAVLIDYNWLKVEYKFEYIGHMFHHNFLWNHLGTRPFARWIDCRWFRIPLKSNKIMWKKKRK